jgi:hypothetical protein
MAPPPAGLWPSKSLDRDTNQRSDECNCNTALQILEQWQWQKRGDGEKGANWRGKKKRASAEELASEGMETDVQRYKSVWGWLGVGNAHTRPKCVVRTALRRMHRTVAPRPKLWKIIHPSFFFQQSILFPPSYKIKLIWNLSKFRSIYIYYLMSRYIQI